MFKIAEFFSTNLKVKEKNDQYWVRTFSLQSNLILMYYLDNTLYLVANI